MGAGIPLDDAALLGTVLEAILYGFSLLMFIATIWVLRREERRYTWLMMSIAILLLVLSTAHMIVDIVRTEEGLVKYRNTFRGGPLAFFGDIAQNTYVMKSAIYILQTLVGDGVVIYRCYVVWQSIWIIILPSMLWSSVAVTGIGSVYSVSRATTDASNIFAKETGRWVTAFFASTLSANLLSTGLLAYRIWTIERNIASVRASKSTLMPVLRVLVDAAVLYSATLFTALLCFVNSNHGEAVLVSMLMPVISIAFYMVMIRIALKQREKSSRLSTSLGRPTAIESQPTNYGTRPLQVHISRYSKCESNPQYQLGNREIEMEHHSSIHKKQFDGATYEA